MEQSKETLTNKLSNLECLELSKKIANQLSGLKLNVAVSILIDVRMLLTENAFIGLIDE
jgi:hypothetical protein